MPEANQMKKLITCPFCFGKFTHDRVHFKAMTVKTDDDIRAMRDNKDTAGLEKARLFAAAEDELFNAFWSKYQGSRGADWALRRNPVITPKDVGTMCSSSFLTDKENMVEKAVDIFGTETTVRICPHCHNPLPKAYGRLPVKFLSVVGITGAGKTVYLSQLLKNIRNYAANVKISAVPSSKNEENFIREFKVAQGIVLPIGTPKEQLTEPLIYNFEKFTLVIYDVAGENCVDADLMQKFGPFIRNADGIIFLLDPRQFSVLNDEGEETADPVAVLDAMFNSFVQDLGKVSTPLAVTFSKSDVMRNSTMLNADSRIFQSVAVTRGGEFDESFHRNIHAELRKLMSQMPEGLVLETSLNRNYSEWAYFAVTALGCGVEVEADLQEPDFQDYGQNDKAKVRYVPVQPPRPNRIEEPLYWILWKWGMIGAKTEIDTGAGRTKSPRATESGNGKQKKSRFGLFGR